MAEKNIKINVKTSTGYDTLYPKSKAVIVDFDNADTNLISENSEDAIKEVNDKFSNYVLKSNIIDNLESTNTDKPLSANMGKQLKIEVDEKALSNHNHDDRYYTESEINTKLIDSIDVSNNYTNFDPSGKFEKPDNINGWIRMCKNGKILDFTSALKIKTNFGKDTNYRICTLPYNAFRTQYGFAISQHTGISLFLYVEAGSNLLYVQTKDVVVSTGDWLWMNIKLICE